MSHVILKITRDDLDYKNTYIGSVDVTDFDGSIEIEAELGQMEFKTGIRVSKCLYAHAGSGIKSDGGIEAGWSISSGSNITASDSINARFGIDANSYINAGKDIKSGEHIRAGSGIRSGSNIEADKGIEAGLAIVAKTIPSHRRIFAGLCLWRQPNPWEMQIRAKLLKGTIAFGELVEPEKTIANSERSSQSTGEAA